MERNFEIPEMKKEEITKWYATIRPIVNHNDGTVYLRHLDEDELTGKSYIGLTNPADKSCQSVNYGQLSVLADVKMLHPYGVPKFFKPSVGEVIRQIPKDLLEKVVAFEIVYRPTSIDDFTLFKEEFDAGLHVSVVRLYQAKNDSNEPASPIQFYPYEGCTLPIGMTEREFRRII